MNEKWADRNRETVKILSIVLKFLKIMVKPDSLSLFILTVCGPWCHITMNWSKAGRNKKVLLSP